MFNNHLYQCFTSQITENRWLVIIFRAHIDSNSLVPNAGEMSLSLKLYENLKWQKNQTITRRRKHTYLTTVLGKNNLRDLRKGPHQVFSGCNRENHHIIQLYDLMVFAIASIEYLMWTDTQFVQISLSDNFCKGCLLLRAIVKSFCYFKLQHEIVQTLPKLIALR